MTAYNLHTTDDPDLIGFTYDFAVKAVDDTDLVELTEDGDLLIEGYAAEFKGIDREGENFAPGAFERAIESFLAGNAPLCYHHKPSKILGKVLDLKEDERGLYMKARVDGAIESHPEYGTYYKQIKKGTLKGLSVGGFFKRALTGEGKKIVDMDFTEISTTGVPVHSQPAFAVVAGKALDEFEDDDEKTPVTPELPDGQTTLDLTPLGKALDEFAATLDKLEGKAVKGEPQDLYFLALILKLEQLTESIATKEETVSGGPSDDRVDALIKEVKDGMDAWARTAHKLAASLGPLPKISYS